MAAGDTQRRTRGEDAWPRQFPGSNGVAQGDVGEGAGADGTNCGEAGLESDTSEVRACERLSRDRYSNCRVPMLAVVASQVHVRIDEAR